MHDFINSSWKRNVKFSMHDSGWLIFNFDSEVDMLEVLNGGLCSWPAFDFENYA